MSNIEYSQNMLLKKPHSVIQFDKTTGELKRPTLLLRKKSGEYLGKLDYTNLKMSLVGKGLDEISFDVHKYVDGKKCPFWEQLTDLKTVEYVGYGCFELSVHLNDAEETVKSCVAISLECELGQLILREGHYNDDDDTVTPRTVLFDGGENGKEHSLLHRVLSGKAPHWSIGFVSPLLNVDGYVYEPNQFQREYTADGISIYDFLTGEVAAESNCIFLFDTYERLIHCVNIESCVYDPATMKVIEGAYKKDNLFFDKTGKPLDNATLAYCDGIGKDTNILVSKQKLAQDFGVEFNKDSVKNCFYVTGGDDVINDWVAAANLSGDNYIYEFSKFQRDDMSDELRNGFDDYRDFLEKKRNVYYGPGGIYVLAEGEEYEYTDGVCRDKYQNIITDFIYDNNTGKLFIKNPYAYKDENGIICDENGEALPADNYHYEGDGGLYTNYCDLVTRRSYLRDSKFPDISIGNTTASDEYEKIEKAFSTDNIKVVVTQAINQENYTIALKNAKTYMEIILDSRYTITIKDSSLENVQSENEYILNTNICISGNTNKTDCIGSEEPVPLSIPVIKLDKKSAEENAYYVKQQLEFKKASLEIASLELSSIPEDELKDFFSQYNLHTLEEYVANFDSCMNILMEMANGDINAESTNSTCRELYKKYVKYRDEAEAIRKQRENQVAQLDESIETLDEKIDDFHIGISLENKLGPDLWKEFHRYVREDDYNNGNYISDGLSDSGLINKARDLLSAATRELQKACMLQRSISVNLMNLFAIPEYQPLFNDFEIFNYIRVNIDDEIYKVRIVQLDFDENTPENIQVTFSEDVEYQDGTVSDLQNMRSQVAGIATSYSSTYRQAKQGAAAQNTLLTMKKEGLLSAGFLIGSSRNEGTVIDNTGILTRSMVDDEGNSDYQCKIIGKGLYLTSDNWNTVSAGIGRMKFNNNWQYGVIADTIVGNILNGNEVTIENDVVKIDKNGIRLKGGSIEWTTPITQDNIAELTDFRESVEDKLSIFDECISATKIGQDYMISPKIGGGYLCIKKDYENGDTCYVKMDPDNTSSDGYLFNIYRKHINNEEDTCYETIMNVDNSGKGYFNGTITSDNITLEHDLEYPIPDERINPRNRGGNINYDGMQLSYPVSFSSGIIKPGSDNSTCLSVYGQNYCTLGTYYDAGLSVLPNAEAQLGGIPGAYNGIMLTRKGMYFGIVYGEDFPDPDNFDSTDYTSITKNTIQTETVYSESQVNTSDKRLKTDIQPISKPIEFIQALQPREFHMVSGKSGRKHFGFLAQDVEKALSCSTGDAGVLVKYSPANKVSGEHEETVDFSDDSTYTYGLRYDEFIAPMVATIQDLYKQIDALKEEIKTLKGNLHT